MRLPLIRETNSSGGSMRRSPPSELERIDVPGANIDPKTVEGFGDEWSAYDQAELSAVEQQRLFGQYFSVFPFDDLADASEGFDLGCGSGRWAALSRRGLACFIASILQPRRLPSLAAAWPTRETSASTNAASTGSRSPTGARTSATPSAFCT